MKHQRQESHKRHPLAKNCMSATPSRLRPYPRGPRGGGGGGRRAERQKCRKAACKSQLALCLASAPEHRKGGRGRGVGGGGGSAPHQASPQIVPNKLHTHARRGSSSACSHSACSHSRSRTRSRSRALSLSLRQGGWRQAGEKGGEYRGKSV